MKRYWKTVEQAWWIASLFRLFIYNKWSPYKQVIWDADIRTMKKRIKAKRIKWHQNPFKFLDADDIYIDPEHDVWRSRQGILAIAENVLAETHGTPSILEDVLHGSEVGSKDVPKAVFIKMLRDALSNFYDCATSAQIEAIVLEREAKQMNITPSTHIAQTRGTSRQAAYQLLKRAKKAILFTIGGSEAILSIDARVKKAAFEMPRVCASCGSDCEHGLQSLCADCHRRFVYRGEFLNDAHRRDIEKAMRLSSVNHMRKARKALELT